MKIVVVTQNAPLYLPTVLDRLLAERADDVAGVLFTRSHTGSLFAEVKQRVDYYGFAGFLQTAFRALAATALGRTPSRIVRSYGVPVLDFPGVNSKEFIEFLRSERVDLLVSIAALEIFRSKVLRTPRLGAINYHTSLLPRHRGRQPLFWALAGGDRRTGVTIHMIDSGIDTGDVILQREVPIAADDSLDSLYNKSVAVGAGALLQVLDMLDSGNVSRMRQDAAEGNYNSFPGRADRRRFLAAGRRFY